MVPGIVPPRACRSSGEPTAALGIIIGHGGAGGVRLPGRAENLGGDGTPPPRGTGRPSSDPASSLLENRWWSQADRRRTAPERSGSMRRRRLAHVEPTQHTQELARRVGRMASPLRGPADLDPLLDRIGDARFVLLGEASHGTSEYYQWR